MSMISNPPQSIRRLTTSLALTAMWFVATASVHAQIELEMSTVGDRFVVGEPVYASIKISNNAGKPIRVGNFPGWMDIAIENKSGGLTTRTSSLAATQGVIVESGKSTDIPIEITELYKLDKRSRYQAKATLRVPGWDQAFSSKEIFFDLVEGNKLWSQKYSSPMLRTAEGGQRVYSYNLIASQGSDGRRLIVQIKDTTYERIVRSVPVCKMVSFSKPEARIDQVSNLHLLCQYGQSYFTYNIYSPVGELLLRMTYQSAPARPTLETDAEGLIIVQGGLRIPMDTDYLPKSN